MYATRDKSYCFDEKGDKEQSLLDLVNEGGLKKPPKELVSDVSDLEEVFRNTSITTPNIYSDIRIPVSLPNRALP